MATDIGNVQIYLGQWWNFGQNFDKRKNSILLTKVFKILKKFLASSLPKQTLLFISQFVDLSFCMFYYHYFAQYL